MFTRALVTFSMNEIEASVRKATYEDEDRCKEKHVQFLVSIIETNSTPIRNIISYIMQRLLSRRWNVLVKTLCLIHRLIRETRGVFIRGLAASGICLREWTNSHPSVASISIEPWEQEQFVHQYLGYLDQRLEVLRSTGLGVELKEPLDAGNELKGLNNDKFLVVFDALLEQFFRLVSVSPIGFDYTGMHDLNQCCFNQLIKDGFRLYSVLTIAAFNVVEKFASLDKLAVAQSFLSLYSRFQSFSKEFEAWALQLCEKKMLDRALLPDFGSMPDATPQLTKCLELLGEIESKPTSSKKKKKKPSRAKNHDSNTVQPLDQLLPNIGPLVVESVDLEVSPPSPSSITPFTDAKIATKHKPLDLDELFS